MKVYDDKYIVITGAAGFIGSCLLKQLNDQGLENIIVVDDLGKDERWKNLVGKRFIDLVHKDDLFEWLRGRENDIEAFFHLGACSSTVETDANYLLENNTRYSIRLAEYALTAGHRFIYASSAATYGDGSQGFSDDHDLLDQLAPLNMYGFSKHLFDLWLKRQHVLDKVVGLKYFNVYGPNEFHKGRMASAIVKMTADCKHKGEISLFASSEPDKYKDGEQIRDFIYVKDAVKMTAQFLTNDCNGIYNIAMGQGTTWNQLAEAVIEAMNIPCKITYFKMPDDLIGKYQNYTVADMSKSKELVKPDFTIKSAVADYVHHHLLEQKYW